MCSVVASLTNEFKPQMLKLSHTLCYVSGWGVWHCIVAAMFMFVSSWYDCILYNFANKYTSTMSQSEGEYSFFVTQLLNRSFELAPPSRLHIHKLTDKLNKS